VMEKCSRTCHKRTEDAGIRLSVIRLLTSIVDATLSDDDKTFVASIGSYFEGSAPLSDGP